MRRAIIKESDDSSSAVFSPDKQHRFFLSRPVGTGGHPVTFILLHPTCRADERVNDFMINKCLEIVEPCREIVVLGLFSIRVDYIDDLLHTEFPVHPDYYLWFYHAIDACLKRKGKVICAWGDQGWYQHRAFRVVGELRSKGVPLHFYGYNKQGEPKSPFARLFNRTTLKEWK